MFHVTHSLTHSLTWLTHSLTRLTWLTRLNSTLFPLDSLTLLATSFAQLVGRHEYLFHPENLCLPWASPTGNMNFLGGTNLHVSLQTRHWMYNTAAKYKTQILTICGTVPMTLEIWPFKSQCWEPPSHDLCTPEPGRPGYLFSMQKDVKTVNVKTKSAEKRLARKRCFPPLYIPLPGFKAIADTSYC